MVKPLQDLGAEHVTITHDPVSRTKIKLEWDSPFRDENQIVDVLCSGRFVAVGDHEKRLTLGKNDASIQALRNQTIRFNGAESDINATQVAPKIRFVIPLPAKVHAQPSVWMCSNSNGKQVRMEGAVSLQELMTVQNGQIAKVDAGMMWIFFKREDAGENKLFRFSPPRPQRHYANFAANNYNYQQPPPQPFPFYASQQVPVANQPAQQPQPFPFYGQQPPAANQPQPPAHQHQNLHEQFQDMTRQLNHMAMMLAEQQQQQQQQHGTAHQQSPNVVRVDDASVSMGVSTQRSTDTTASLGEDEDQDSDL